MADGSGVNWDELHEGGVLRYIEKRRRELKAAGKPSTTKAALLSILTEASRGRAYRAREELKKWEVALGRLRKRPSFLLRLATAADLRRERRWRQEERIAARLEGTGEPKPPDRETTDD